MPLMKLDSRRSGSPGRVLVARPRKCLGDLVRVVLRSDPRRPSCRASCRPGRTPLNRGVPKRADPWTYRSHVSRKGSYRTRKPFDEWDMSL